MSKWIILLGLCCLFLSAGIVNAQEPESTITAKVCHYYYAINMRAEPTTASRIIGQVNQDQTLIVLDKLVRGRGTWSRVQVAGTEQIGWVYGYYLTYEPPEQHITRPNVNVRVYPHPYAEVIMQAQEGDAIRVLGYESIYGNFGTWYLVRHLATGAEGWVYRQYVQGDSFGCLPVVATPEDGQVIGAVWTSENPVEVYAEAYQIGSHPLAKLWDGMKVQMIDQIVTDSDVWSKVRVLETGVEGWVEGAPRTTQYRYSNGMLSLPVEVRSLVNALHVRAEPHMASPILSDIQHGTCMLVTDTRRVGETGWAYLPDAGGWASMDYMEPC